MTSANDPWGRVDADGTVYVRTAEGERVVGSWQAGSPDEALAFFRRKFESLDTEITLLEQRVTTTDLSPAQARGAIERLQVSVSEAHAVGDFPYDVSADGQRFLVAAAREQKSPTALTLVENWAALLKKK